MESDSPELSGHKETPGKWYHKTWAIIVAIACFGPIALPLVWGRPRTSLPVKALVTVAVVLLTVWMLVGAARSVEIIMEHYRELAEALR